MLTSRSPKRSARTPTNSSAPYGVVRT
jgi:hypothetical protein